MIKYTPPKSELGSRIMEFRKSNKLTQADLAQRYEVSGPAVFKFEKGFVTPSLKLWQKIAADMDIPEKEAVLLWIKEKLPVRMHPHLLISAALDVDALKVELEKAGKDPSPQEAIQEVIVANPDITPSLKNFASERAMWRIFKPTLKEVLFLVEIDHHLPRLSVNQFRDLLVVARAIQNPED
jgi:DNA-binding XRE family transcriptional regulator